MKLFHRHPFQRGQRVHWREQYLQVVWCNDNALEAGSDPLRLQDAEIECAGEDLLCDMSGLRAANIDLDVLSSLAEGGDDR